MSGQFFFRVPFASSGDKTAIPTPAQGSGTVSYTEGWGFDYERDPTSDPDAKRIPRDETNQFYFDVTDNLRQYQLNGFPEWVTSAQNDGSPVAYGLGAYVRYETAPGVWGVFASLVTNNTAAPTDATKWRAADPFNQALFTSSNADLQATTAAKTNVFVTPAALIRSYREGRWDNAGVATVTGGNALAATYADGGAFSAIQGAQVVFRVNVATTADNATLNVNAAGAVALFNSTGGQLLSGDLQPNRPYFAKHNGTAWFLQTPVTSQFATVGAADQSTAGIARFATAGEVNALVALNLLVAPGTIPLAGTGQRGLIKIATTGEANALTLNNVALTPGNVPLATQGQGGVVRFADPTEAAARASSTLALSPATLDAALPPRLRGAPTSAGAGITNWNTVVEPGWYFANGALNAPAGLTAVSVTVLAVDANTVVQEATQISLQTSGNSNTYRRTLTSGIWSAWWRVYQSAAEINGAVTLPNRLAADPSGALPLPTDWNNVKDAGWYYAAGGANGPAALGGNGLSVLVQNIGAGNVMQTATAIAVATEADTKTYRRYFSGAWGAWFKVPQSALELAAVAGPRTGDIKLQGTAAVEAGWYACDGAAKSRTTDAALFAVIGEAFGAGNGATTFNLPDLRGRVPRGIDGGTARGGPALGEVQGDQVGSHTHPNGYVRTGARYDAGGGNNAITADTAYTPYATGENAAGQETRVKAQGVVFVIKA